MKQENKGISKRKFLQLGFLGFLFSAIGLNLFRSNSTEKIKMLTADGKLVEVEKSKVKLKANQKPVSNAEIKQWMN